MIIKIEKARVIWYQKSKRKINIYEILKLLGKLERYMLVLWSGGKWKIKVQNKSSELRSYKFNIGTHLL